MARILLFARDPGAGNVVLPLARRLRVRRHTVMLFAKDFALHAWRSSGEPVSPLPGRVRGSAEASRLLRGLHPDAVVTGTSADDFTERRLWEASEALGIPSVAVLDQWMNYGIRFSPLKTFDAARFRGKDSIRYMPRRVLVMDRLAATEAALDGLPVSRLRISGHPHLETIAARASPVPRVPPGEPMRIAFVSEPVLEQYPPEDCGDFWGYDQRRIFSAIVTALSAACARTHRPAVLTVRPHPKETLLPYGPCRDPRLTVHVAPAGGPGLTDLLDSSHLVCGMSSMALLEAASAGVPVMSVQIGLKRMDPFVLARNGTLRTILTDDALMAELVGGLRSGRFQAPARASWRGSAARAVRAIEGLLG